MSLLEKYNVEAHEMSEDVLAEVVAYIRVAFPQVVDYESTQEGDVRSYSPGTLVRMIEGQFGFNTPDLRDICYTLVDDVIIEMDQESIQFYR